MDQLSRWWHHTRSLVLTRPQFQLLRWWRTYRCDLQLPYWPWRGLRGFLPMWLHGYGLDWPLTCAISRIHWLYFNSSILDTAWGTLREDCRLPGFSGFCSGFKWVKACSHFWLEVLNIVLVEQASDVLWHAGLRIRWEKIRRFVFFLFVLVSEDRERSTSYHSISIWY